jgi:hypothetical protein
MTKPLPFMLRLGQPVPRSTTALRDDRPSADDPLPAVVIVDAAGAGIRCRPGLNPRSATGQLVRQPPRPLRGKRGAAM